MKRENMMTPPLAGADYLAPSVDVIDIDVEAGFATSFSTDPTVDSENEIDPYSLY